MVALTYIYCSRCLDGLKLCLNLLLTLWSMCKHSSREHMKDVGHRIWRHVYFSIFFSVYVEFHHYCLTVLVSFSVSQRIRYMLVYFLVDVYFFFFYKSLHNLLQHTSMYILIWSFDLHDPSLITHHIELVKLYKSLNSIIMRHGYFSIFFPIYLKAS